MQHRVVRNGLFVLVAGALFGLYVERAPANHEGNAILSATNFFGTGVLDVDFIITVDPPSDAGCLAHSWTLDFGDGSFPQSGGTTGTFAVPHQYTNFSPSTQIFFAELQFTRQGQHEPRGPRCETSVSQTQLVITVEPALPLIAIVLTPEPIVGPPPVEVGFEAFESMTDPNCLPIRNHSWDFGDGMSAEGAMVSHTYMDVGLYEVMLSLEDRCGRRDSTRGVVFVRRLVPEEFDEIAMALEEIGMSIQSTRGKLEEAQMFAEEKFSMPFAELGQGAGAGALGSAAQGLLMGLCDQETLTDRDAVLLDHLISLLEQAISKMGFPPDPFSEAKPHFETALMKLQDAKAKLASDPAGAFMAACGSDGALMMLGDGMSKLVAALMKTLMMLQQDCDMLQMDVADLLMAVQKTQQGLTEIYDRPDEGFDGSALKEAIGQAMGLLYFPPDPMAPPDPMVPPDPMAATTVLEHAEKTLHKLCQDLEQYPPDPMKLFEGLHPPDPMAPESVAKLQRLLNRVKDAIREVRESPIYGDRPEGESSVELELFLEAITPLSDAVFGFTCLGHFVTPGMVGTDAADTIAGTPQGDVINARGGSDTVVDEGGDNIICGGDGSDWLDSHNGDDIIDGGSGNDYFAGSGGNDILIGGSGDDIMHGHNEDDTLYGEEGNDDLFGWQGNDHLHGGSGNDELFGMTGDDNIYGGDGNDAISGGQTGVFSPTPSEVDFCSGGPGDDYFVNGVDDCEQNYSIP